MRSIHTLRHQPRGQTRPHSRSHQRTHIARWRSSAPERGHDTDHRSHPALVFCLLLASGYGRAFRMLAGGLLISLASNAPGGIISSTLAVVGLIMLLEPMFDLCIAAPLLGCPVDGAEIRKRAVLTL